MSDITYSLTETRFIENMNTAKHITLKALLREKIITKQQYEVLHKTLVIIPIKKGYFGEVIGKLFGEPDKDNTIDFKVAKMVDVDNKLDDLEPSGKPETKEEDNARFKEL